MSPNDPRVHAQYSVEQQPAMKMLYNGTTGMSGIVAAKMRELMILQAQEKDSNRNLILLDL